MDEFKREIRETFARYLKVSDVSDHQKRELAKLASTTRLRSEIRKIAKSSKKHSKQFEELEKSANSVRYAGANTELWEHFITEMRQYASAHPRYGVTAWFAYVMRLGIAQDNDELSSEEHPWF